MLCRIGGFHKDIGNDGIHRECKAHVMRKSLLCLHGSDFRIGILHSVRKKAGREKEEMATEEGKEERLDFRNIDASILPADADGLDGEKRGKEGERKECD